LEEVRVNSRASIDQPKNPVVVLKKGLNISLEIRISRPVTYTSLARRRGNLAAPALEKNANIPAKF
jgi:hypothetical protein